MALRVRATQTETRKGLDGPALAARELPRAAHEKVQPDGQTYRYKKKWSTAITSKRRRRGTQEAPAWQNSFALDSYVDFVFWRKNE